MNSALQAAAQDQVLAAVHRCMDADLSIAVLKSRGELTTWQILRTQILSVCDGDPDPCSAPLETSPAAEVVHRGVVRGLVSLFNDLNSWLENT